MNLKSSREYICPASVARDGRPVTTSVVVPVRGSYRVIAPLAAIGPNDLSLHDADASSQPTPEPFEPRVRRCTRGYNRAMARPLVVLLIDDQPFIGELVKRLIGSEPSISLSTCHEATEGVGDTGIRPGIIGEIGTDKPWVSALEERVHRAAARAARRTGLALTTHSVLSPVSLDQLRIFEDEGADPSRVVIGHSDSYPHLDHYLAIVERGASIEFDFLGMSFTPAERHGEGRIVELLCELLSRGHVEHVLLSQDVCHDSQLQRYGGNGYTYLASTFLPRLREAGVSEAEIETMTVANPRRLLSIA